MRVLLLHFQGPLMSFGGPRVDQIGPSGQFPTVSQVAGMFGNALGYDYREADCLQALQDRLSIASVVLRKGEEMEDCQTVDFGQEHLRTPAWTTRGRREHREGAPATRFGTHIRLQRYRADSQVLAAVALDPPDPAPTVDDLAAALDRPARPLSLGRKTCVPAGRIVMGVVPEACGLTDAIRRVRVEFPERWAGFGLGDGPLSVDAECVPADATALEGARPQVVVDQRDWASDLHGGQRAVVRGRLTLDPAEASAGESR